MDSSAPPPPPPPYHHHPPATSPPPPPPPTASHDLEVTVVSAKHLKNVNWRSGSDLKPYAVAYLHPGCRSATKADDSGNTRPVWNERLSLPLPPSFSSIYDEDGGADDPSAPLLLTIDVFHSKPSETPKPLVGTARSPLSDLLESPSPIKTLELRRPSGRPQGKIRIKLAIRERPSSPPDPNYSRFAAPPPSAGYFYSSVPPPPPPHSSRPPSAADYRTYSPPLPFPSPYGGHHHPAPPQPPHYPYGSYSDRYSAGYYSYPAGYYSAPAPDGPYYERTSSNGAPSAPSDYPMGFSSSSPSPSYKGKGGRAGLGTGLAVETVTGALGGVTLDDGKKNGEEKIAERVESDFAARDDYRDYRADY